MLLSFCNVMIRFHCTGTNKGNKDADKSLHRQFLGSRCDPFGGSPGSSSAGRECKKSISAVNLKIFLKNHVVLKKKIRN